MGNVEGMYVRGCAIHNTFNRAVAIHGKNILVGIKCKTIKLKAKLVHITTNLLF